jgi:hypothetical protein
MESQHVTLLQLSLYQKEQAPSQPMLSVSVLADRTKCTGYLTRDTFDTSSNTTLLPFEPFRQILHCTTLDSLNRGPDFGIRDRPSWPIFDPSVTIHCYHLSRSGKFYTVPLSTVRTKGPEFGITECLSRAIFDISQNIHYVLPLQ